MYLTRPTGMCSRFPPPSDFRFRSLPCTMIHEVEPAASEHLYLTISYGLVNTSGGLSLSPPDTYSTVSGVRRTFRTNMSKRRLQSKVSLLHTSWTINTTSLLPSRAKMLPSPSPQTSGGSQRRGSSPPWEYTLRGA